MDQVTMGKNRHEPRQECCLRIEVEVKASIIVIAAYTIGVIQASVKTSQFWDTTVLVIVCGVILGLLAALNNRYIP